MFISVIAARLLLRGLKPGNYPAVAACTFDCGSPSRSLGCPVRRTSLAHPWISYYARALGAKVASGVDLHTLPPITGMLKIGAGASIEPEVDLRGYWIDGDLLRVGEIVIGAESSVGSRSTLLPGARIGKGAEIAAGSSVQGRIPSGQLWAGSPAVRVGKAKNTWPEPAASRGSSRWLAGYGAGSIGLSLLPLFSIALGVRDRRRPTASRTEPRRRHPSRARTCSTRRSLRPACSTPADDPSSWFGS
jgi:non-ribosomal peptide synthetase-like protein